MSQIKHPSQIAAKTVQLNNPILKLLTFNKDFFPTGSFCTVVFSLKTFIKVLLCFGELENLRVSLVIVHAPQK